MSWCQYQEYPETWDDFITAIAQPDTEVFCPEDGVWDVGQTHPDGYNGEIFHILCDKINGRGTIIKNLKLTNSFFKLESENSTSQARLEYWNALHLINMVVDNGYSAVPSADKLFQGGQRVYTIDGQPVTQPYVQCSGSQFSGMFAVPTQGGSPFAVFGEMEMWCCACNLELIRGTSNSGVKSYSIGRRQDYCNFKVSARGFTEVYTSTNTGAGSSYSWFDLYGDDITTLSMTWKAHACAIRCSANVTTVSKAEQGYPTVVAVPDPLTVVLPDDSNLIVCTDAELRDEEYLHNAGFPIGVPENAPE